MEIILNGEKKRFEKTLNAAELVKLLGLDPKTVLVELNLHAIPRDEMAKVFIRDGDRVEIIGLFGGG
ncbi:MAG: sulfur carrier protein ThiS [Deltaproteobacteria bacterium]|nr:sulfur carrier protein ThiS [Deltaproteobacteria bacterium]MBW2137181.1 sulfur carrier protein ThiS [Deltaproteobacteria bacterium]